MSEKHNFTDSIGFHLCDGGIYVGKIFVQVAHLKHLLSREQRTAIFTQIDSVECISGTHEHSCHLGLKEIVAETMHIEHAYGPRRRDDTTHDGATHMARIVVGLLHVFHPEAIAKTAVGKPIYVICIHISRTRAVAMMFGYFMRAT